MGDVKVRINAFCSLIYRTLKDKSCMELYDVHWLQWTHTLFYRCRST